MLMLEIQEPPPKIQHSEMPRQGFGLVQNLAILKWDRCAIHTLSLHLYI